MDVLLLLLLSSSSCLLLGEFRVASSLKNCCSFVRMYVDVGHVVVKYSKIAVVRAHLGRDSGFLLPFQRKEKKEEDEERKETSSSIRAQFSLKRRLGGNPLR